MGFHFWRVRKAGGVVFEKDGSETENKLVTTLPIWYLENLLSH